MRALLAIVLARFQAGALPWQCFHDLGEFIACCSVLNDRRAECFGEGRAFAWSEAERCCSGDVAGEVRRMSEAALASSGNRTDVLDQVLVALESFLVYHDPDPPPLWELLARAAALRGLAEFRSSSGRVLVARRLQFALQTAEAFFNVARNVEAFSSGRSVKEVLPDDARWLERSSGVLALYREAAAAHDSLLFDDRPPSPPREAHAPSSPALPPETSPSGVAGGFVCLVVAVVGRWARTSAVTLHGVLRRRARDGRRLRIFVLGDPTGLADFADLWKELQAKFVGPDHADVAAQLASAEVRSVDILASPFMKRYLRSLPKACSKDLPIVGIALYARLLCHELLPPHVDRCIAMDLGDILVLDDIAELYDFGDQLGEREVLAAGWHGQEEEYHHSKPSRINAGVVLYDLRKMRQRNFTADTLKAAAVGLRRGYSNFCVWDQDIINALDVDVYPARPEGSRIRRLPCRWNLIPAMGWQPEWNTFDGWPTDVVLSKRYPGVLTTDQVELYCPSRLDILQLVHIGAPSREARSLYRRLALHRGHGDPAAASSARPMDPGFAGRGCLCGERAGALHVLSTLKRWPFAQRLFASHAPPGFDAVGGFLQRQAQDSGWMGGGFWGGGTARDFDGIRAQSFVAAAAMGYVSRFRNCATFPTLGGETADYAAVPWEAGPGGRPVHDAGPIHLAMSFGDLGGGSAFIFLGRLQAAADGMSSAGLEVELAMLPGARSVPQRTELVLRWGARQRELARAVYDGSLVTTRDSPLDLYIDSRRKLFKLSVGSVFLAEGYLPDKVAAVMRQAGARGIRQYAASRHRRLQWLLCNCFVEPRAAAGGGDAAAGTKRPSWQLCDPDRVAA